MKPHFDLCWKVFMPIMDMVMDQISWTALGEAEAERKVLSLSAVYREEPLPQAEDKIEGIHLICFGLYAWSALYVRELLGVSYVRSCEFSVSFVTDMRDWYPYRSTVEVLKHWFWIFFAKTIFVWLIRFIFAAAWTPGVSCGFNSKPWQKSSFSGEPSDYPTNGTIFVLYSESVGVKQVLRSREVLLKASLKYWKMVFSILHQKNVLDFPARKKNLQVMLFALISGIQDIPSNSAPPLTVSGSEEIWPAAGRKKSELWTSKIVLSKGGGDLGAPPPTPHQLNQFEGGSVLNAPDATREFQSE